MLKNPKRFNREIDLLRWKNVPLAKRKIFAHNICKARGENRSDPFETARVYKNLTQCIETPADYGQEQWRV